MGIPYYFYVLTKKYDSILLENITFNIDILCFDFNGIIQTANNLVEWLNIQTEIDYGSFTTPTEITSDFESLV